MKLPTKITNTKTSTIVILVFVISAVGYFTPWIAYWVNEFIDGLLYATASSGPYRLTDKKLYEFFADAYHAHWYGAIQTFYVLATIQLIIVALLSLYLLVILYGRYKTGTAKLWQLLVSTALVLIVAVSMWFALYVSFIEEEVYEQVDIVNEAVPAWETFL